MSMNYDMAKKAFQAITECPLKMKNVLLVANCRDIAMNIKGGSNFIWLPYEPSPFELSVKEKCILIAEIIKRLNLTMDEVKAFIMMGG